MRMSGIGDRPKLYATNSLKIGQSPIILKHERKITPIPSLDRKQDSKHGIKGDMLFLTLEMLLLFVQVK